MRPTPISATSSGQVNRPMANAEGVTMEMVDACCTGCGNLPQRAKPPYAGCEVCVRDPRDSARLRTCDQIPLDKVRAGHARANSVMSCTASINFHLAVGVVTVSC